MATHVIVQLKAALRDPRLAYPAAGGATLFASLARAALNPLVQNRAPWIFYFPAIAITAWQFGAGPAVFALFLSTLVGWYFWIPPVHTLTISDPRDYYVISAFFLSSAVIVAFGASNERTRRRLEAESASRERASRELVESLESFRSVFEHAQGDAVILMDATFTVQAWNPGAEAAFGYAPGEALDRPVDFIFPVEERAELRRSRAVATESGSAPEVGWYQRKDGSRFWGEGSLIALHDASGGIRGYLKVLRDETARREVADAGQRHAEALEQHVAEQTADLRAANAELEGFTYSVSHDMRAPIRAIVANARLLVEDFGDDLPGDSRERIERMATNGRRLGLLIEDLLTYARLNKQELKKAPVDLAALFREVAADFDLDPPIEAVAPSTLPVLAEPGLMRMVLENIVGNAVKYRRPEVPLRLEMVASEREGTPSYAVRDNGIGFEMTYAPKLFQPFERLHRNEAYEGTGIGLANVKRIVERHGGTVWAEGEPGVGATFGFTLPA